MKMNVDEYALAIVRRRSILVLDQIQRVGQFEAQYEFVNKYGFINNVLIPAISCSGGEKEENSIVIEIAI